MQSYSQFTQLLDGDQWGDDILAYTVVNKDFPHGLRCDLRRFSLGLVQIQHLLDRTCKINVSNRS